MRWTVLLTHFTGSTMVCTASRPKRGCTLDFCASFVAMLAVSCWDINSPLRFPAGTTRMQVTAMDTADDKNTYNAATAHITVPQHSSTLSARAPSLCSLQGWIDRVGSRRVPWVVWSTYICPSWQAQTPANQSRLLLGTDTGQSEQTLTWNVHQPAGRGTRCRLGPAGAHRLALGPEQSSPKGSPEYIRNVLTRLPCT